MEESFEKPCRYLHLHAKYSENTSEYKKESASVIADIMQHIGAAPKHLAQKPE